MVPRHPNEPTPPEVAIAVGWLHWQRQEPDVTHVCFAVARRHLPADAKAWLEQQPELDPGDGLLWMWYPHVLVELTTDARVLEPTITLAQAVVEQTADAADLACLSTAHRGMFIATGDETHLVKALATAEAAVGATRDDDPDGCVYLATLAMVIHDQADSTGDVRAFDAAVTTMRAAIERTPDDHPGRTVFAGDLGTMLLGRSRTTGSLQDLDDAVQALSVAAQTDGPARGIHLSMLNFALLQRFERTGADRDLHESEAAGRSAVALIPEGDPNRRTALTNLANALRGRFTRTDRLELLSEAADILREAAQGAENPATRAMILSNLGITLGDRSVRTNSEADLNEAIEVLQDALARIPDGYPRAAHLLVNLGNALLRRYERTGSAEALAQSIEMLRDALRLAPSDFPDRFVLMMSLATASKSWFERTGDMAYLDEAVRLHRQALATAPHDHPGRAAIQANLAVALSARYSRGGSPQLLDDAIELTRSAVAALPRDHPARGQHLSNLAADLDDRFKRFGRLDDLNESVDLGKNLLVALPPGHPDRIRLMSNLAKALYARYERLGAVPDLDQTVELLEAVVEGTTTDHSRHPSRLADLAVARQTRYERFGRTEDLDEAVRLKAAAVAAAPADHPGRALYLSGLSISQRTRYERFGDVADLNAAIESARLAVDATPGDHPDMVSRLGTLSHALMARYQRQGDLEDLNEAMDVTAQMVTRMPADHPDYGRALAGRATVLSARFERLARLADLTEAIDTCRRAVASTPPDQPAVYSYRQNLAGYLQLRYDRVGDLTDLDDAITNTRAVIAATPGEAPDRDLMMLNLARYLNSRLERTGDPAHSDEAITIYRELLASTPADHADRAARLTGLAAALRIRVEVANDPSVLDEAVEIARLAVATTPAGHQNLTPRQSNLSAVLQMRFAVTQSVDDIDEAVQSAALAATASRKGAVHHAFTLFVAARARGLRWSLTKQAEDLDKAFDLFRAALDETTAPTNLRVRTAIQWGMLAGTAGRHETAVEGFTEALALLPTIAWVGASRTTREHSLRAMQGLASAAAAAALSAGKPELAVTLLEQGRSVLWTQALGLRDDFGTLATVDRDLAEQLRGLAAELDTGAGDREQRIQLADRWDTLLTSARAVPGMADLLRTPTFETLCQGLGEHPVVIVNLAAPRCDALIVSNSEVTVVDLPNVYNDVGHRADAYLVARTTLDAPGSTPLDRAAAEQTVLATLEWLWDNVAGPVLARVDPPNGELPRIIWCPTGPLTVLPLHAAGYHDEPDGETVLDRVVSSYAPTLHALTKARTAANGANDRVLVVATPTVEGLPPLPGAREEADLISARFAATSRVGTQATRAEVLNDLRSHAYVHFACHGGLQVDNPSEGALYLHDGPLTVLDVAALRLTGAQFAFLSACHTAVGGVDLLDESIHMAGALQLAGYRQVIATLWTIADQPAAHIAARVYDLASDGQRLDLTRTARALHQVVRELRDAYPDNPARWASYIHTGP